jgi:hypothetical protein
MKYNQYTELTSLVDDDVLLIQEGSTLALRKVKLSTLKQYIGVATTPTPATIPIGYVKWYRGDSVILDSNNNIAQVVDKSTGNNLTPYSGNTTLVKNAINGQDAITFNNSAMKHIAESYAAKTIFIIYRSRNSVNYTDYDMFFHFLGNGNPIKVPLSNEHIYLSGKTASNYVIGSDTTTKVYRDNSLQNTSDFTVFNTQTNSYAGIPPGTFNEFHLLEMEQSSSSIGTKNMIVGADNYTAVRYLKDTDIAELIIYPTILSTTDRTSILAYFKSRYNFSFL